MDKIYWRLKIYLIVVFIFGILGLIDSFISVTTPTSSIYFIILTLVSFLFFFFNIFSLIHFIHDHLEKITWVLPIYHLIRWIIFLFLGLILNTFNLMAGNVLLIFSIIGILTSLFEILSSIYIFKKFF